MNIGLVTEKIKQYPIAFGCGALLIVFGVLIFLRGGVLTELELKESDLNARIRTIEQNIKNAINIEQDTEDLGLIVEKMNTLLFNPYERAININFFYGLEDGSDVVISGISQLPLPDPIYAEKGLRELKLHTTLVYDLSFSGTFANVLKFMHEIDRVEPFIRVADFQLSRNEQVTGNQVVTARLRLLVLAKKN